MLKERDIKDIFLLNYEIKVEKNNLVLAYALTSFPNPYNLLTLYDQEHIYSSLG